MAGVMPTADLDAVRVLDLVRRQGPLTRLAIKQQLGLGRATADLRVDGLAGAGLLIEAETGPSTGGRAPRTYRFAAEAGVVLAAVIGTENFFAGVTTLDGRILARRSGSFPLRESPERVLGLVVDALEDALASSAVPKSSVWGVGMGLSGPVEFSTGLPVSPLSLPGWNHFPVRRYLEDALGVMCLVDNDANLMALGELRCGVAKSTQHMIFVYVATGVGVGLVSRGDLHRGAAGGAGDIGHLQVVDDPYFTCVCGNFGCLSASAGGLGLEHRMRRASGESHLDLESVGSGDSLHYREVLQAADRGDRAALGILSDAARLLGETVSTLVNIFNPEIVVLGGPISTGHEIVEARVREVVYQRSLPIATKQLTIATTSLGRDAGLAGAAHMIVDHVLEPATMLGWYRPGDPAGRPLHVATQPA